MSYDITANKHGDNPESEAAFSRGEPSFSIDRQACYDFICERPSTAKECAVLLGKSFNAVSGRLSELKKAGLVEKTGEIRDGSAVLRATAP